MLVATQTRHVVMHRHAYKTYNTGPDGGVVNNVPAEFPRDEEADACAWLAKRCPYGRVGKDGVTSIRVERLQDISEEDARASGVEPLAIAPSQRIAGDELRRTQATHPHVLAFAVRWDEANRGRRMWAANPWVWVVSRESARVDPTVAPGTILTGSALQPGILPGSEQA